jgi:hypothetical protein
MKSLKNSRNKLIEKRIKANSPLGAWLSNLAVKYGDKFNGWAVNGGTLVITGFSPSVVIITQNAAQSFVTFTMTKNSSGKFSALFAWLINATSGTNLNTTGAAGTTSITFNVNNSVLLNNQVRIVATTDTNLKKTVGVVNAAYPWGIVQKYPSILLPLSTSISQTLTVNVPNNLIATYIKSLTSLSGDFIVTINITTSGSIGTTTTYVGISSDLNLNGTASTGAINTSGGMNGMFLLINNGTAFINGTTTTTFSGWGSVIPNKVTIASINNIIYFGQSSTSMSAANTMWGLNNTAGNWQSSQRYLTIIIGAGNPTNYVLNFTMTDG